MAFVIYTLQFIKYTSFSFFVYVFVWLVHACSTFFFSAVNIIFHYLCLYHFLFSECDSFVFQFVYLSIFFRNFISQNL